MPMALLATAISPVLALPAPAGERFPETLAMPSPGLPNAVLRLIACAPAATAPGLFCTGDLDLTGQSIVVLPATASVDRNDDGQWFARHVSWRKP